MAVSRMIAIELLKVTIFVRTSLDEDRVMQLALLYEKDPELLPPIQVNADNEVIDGRHRLEAARLAGLKEIACIPSPKGLSRGEEVLTALAANMGGAKPPTATEIRISIQAMLQAGLKQTQILQGLPLPPSVGRRYITDAQSALSKMRLARALDAVADGEISTTDAAERFGIDVESIRVALRGKKSKLAEDHFGLPKLKGG